MKFLESAYILAIGASFIVSLISFRYNFPLHLKFFSILLGITLAAELTAVYLFRALHLGTNSPVYNSFMLVEFCSYSFFYMQIYRHPKVIAVTKAFLILIPVCWIDSTILKFGFLRWNSYFSIVGSSCTVILAVIYYAQLLSDTDPIKPLKHPEFLISTGLLILYTCTIPYLGCLNYLVSYNLPLATSLLDVLRILNIIMYSLFLYAFICQMTTRKL